MSVNPAIYGTPEEWGVANLGTPQNHADRKDSFLTAHFGGGGNTLEKGYGYGIAINTPIDKSLSYCGLGSLSTWSRVEYYKRDRDLTLIAADDRTVTNFSFNQAVKISTMTGIWYTENSAWSSVPYGSLTRFAPQAVNTNERANYNNGFIPITQIPIKNCVLVPIFRVAKQINTDGTTTGMDVATVSCWDYYGTTATRNHTTHPYILGIGFQFYTKTSDTSSQRSGVASNTSALLDKLALYKGQPVNLNEPTQNVLDGGFSYCWNVPQSTFPYKTIFGYVNNGAATVPNAIDYYNNELPSEIRSSLLRAIAIFPHENAVFSNEWTVNANTYARYYYLQYYDGLQEWVRHQLACFGLFFTDDEDTAKTGEYDDDNMMLGILVDGVGHGDYTHGADNRLQPQWEWDTTNDSDYDPSNPPHIDPNSYNGSMDTGSLVLFGTATERYNVSAVNMALGLLPKLWDIMAMAEPDEAINDYSLKTFLTNNPIDCIVSLQYLPVKNMGTGNSTTIKLGNKDTQISAYHAKTSMLYDCGNYEIYPRFGNNWIDRETKITLYLPFCGVVDLDPETYMGKTVNVEYAIDLTTGTCSAFVSFIGAGGGKVITDVANGACAIDLPVTGIQQQTLNAQLFNASESTKQMKVNNALKGFKTLMGAVSSLSGARANPLGAVSGLLDGSVDMYNIFQDEKIADWNLQHTMLPTKMIGASGGLTGAMCELKPTIIFSRPTTDYNVGAYAHSVGFACCKQGVLSAFSGYTECTNVDLSGFNATATEKNMIQAALAGGVYL